MRRVRRGYPERNRFIAKAGENLGSHRQKIRFVIDQQHALAVAARQRGRRVFSGDRCVVRAREVDAKGASPLGMLRTSMAPRRR